METSAAFRCIAARHERVAAALKLYWGERELVPYVQQLLSDRRDSNRQGFPPDSIIALLNLLEQHKREFPDFTPTESAAVWLANQKVR